RLVPRRGRCRGDRRTVPGACCGRHSGAERAARRRQLPLRQPARSEGRRLTLCLPPRRTVAAVTKALLLACHAARRGGDHLRAGIVLGCAIALILAGDILPI